MGSLFAIILGLGSLAAISTAVLEFKEYRKRKGLTLKNEDRGIEEEFSIRDKVNIALCAAGFHTWTNSVLPEVQYCSRFCHKRRCVDDCQYETVYQDDVCSIERCSTCGDVVKYGDY